MLTTAREEIQLYADIDKIVLRADGEDLSLITVKLVDKNGVENLWAPKKVAVFVEGGGKLETFGSADSQFLINYDDTR